MPIIPIQEAVHTLNDNTMMPQIYLYFQHLCKIHSHFDRLSNFIFTTLSRVGYTKWKIRSREKYARRARDATWKVTSMCVNSECVADCHTENSFIFIVLSALSCMREKVSPYFS